MYPAHRSRIFSASCCFCRLWSSQSSDCPKRSLDGRPCRIELAITAANSGPVIYEPHSGQPYAEVFRLHRCYSLRVLWLALLFAPLVIMTACRAEPVDRSLDPLGPFTPPRTFSLLDFGAVGDGRTDDTVA